MSINPNKNNKICKHFVNGSCKKGPQCEFNHIDNICSNYFFGECKQGDSCGKSHQYKLKNKENKNKKNKPKLIKKNTESFDPFTESGDMRIMIGDQTKSVYNHEIKTRDVVLINNLFGTNDSMDIYNKLLGEIKATGTEEKGLWKLWHGDTHHIADDHVQWKSKCPTFTMIINKIKDYFQMDIKATRLNWYKDSTEFKPYHHDAAAVDPDKASKQNFTVGVSFGATRTASFQHAKTRTVIDFPLINGMTYCFSKDTNIEWRHGIPQSTEANQNLGRISIIAWGWADMK
jgi:hypothetical protein